MSESFELPLFPLELVLFPFQQIPLHIFEGRYRQMIKLCMDTKVEFGIVCGTDDDFCDTGCAATVSRLVTRFPDGRMNILVRGTRRFRAMKRLDVHPYISGIVEEVEDATETPDTELADRALTLYQDAVKLSLGWLHWRRESTCPPSELSYTIAASLNLTLSQKQAFLETTSVNRRLQSVSDTLENALKTVREIKRRTRGNGHMA
jgi:ATP-dependent Lon protease